MQGIQAALGQQAGLAHAQLLKAQAEVQLRLPPAACQLQHCAGTLHTLNQLAACVQSLADSPAQAELLLHQGSLHACAALKLADMLQSSSLATDAEQQAENSRLERVASGQTASCSTAAAAVPEQCCHAVHAWQARVQATACSTGQPATVSAAAKELYTMLVHLGHAQAASEAHLLLQGFLPVSSLMSPFSAATASSSSSSMSAANQRAVARSLPAGGGTSLPAVLQRAEAHLQASVLFVLEGTCWPVIRC